MSNELNVLSPVSNEVATEVVPARVEIRLVGETLAERKLNVVHRGASPAALLVLAAAKGKVGQAARGQAALRGSFEVQHAAANSNYRPLAELYAATTGYDITIANRKDFETLPNVIDALISAVTTTKSKGMTTDKEGVAIPNAKHAALLGIRSTAVECIAYAAQVHAERNAKRLADAAKQAE